jgi:hypothetical protein
MRIEIGNIVITITEKSQCCLDDIKISHSSVSIMCSCPYKKGRSTGTTWGHSQGETISRSTSRSESESQS